jgi:A/G-specific adenine glycosylase
MKNPLAPSLLTWWATNRRNLPWRTARDPYRIAVTELMLVRTRASQVAETWDSFFRRFPTLKALASTTDSDIENALSSLGLSWRIRVVGAFARRAHEQFGDGLPFRAAELLGLPAIGEYAASAVEVVTTGEGCLPVDTGIARLLSRFYGIQAKGELRRNSRIQAIAKSLSPVSREGFFALLDLCAKACIAGQPKCLDCPLLDVCRHGRREVEVGQQSDVGCSLPGA